MLAPGRLGAGDTQSVFPGILATRPDCRTIDARLPNCGTLLERFGGPDRNLQTFEIRAEARRHFPPLGAAGGLGFRPDLLGDGLDLGEVRARVPSDLRFTLANGGKKHRDGDLVIRRLQGAHALGESACRGLWIRLGDRGGALDAFERAYEERDGFLVHIAVDPRLEPLHREPRFRRLLGELGLEPD